jgi:hypothetical protein
MDIRMWITDIVINSDGDFASNPEGAGKPFPQQRPKAPRKKKGRWLSGPLSYD